MVINHNMSAAFASRNLKHVGVSTQKDLEKLSSGQRINRASDDAAGLAISEKMRAQVRGLNQASENAGDGISLIQTADGYLSETTNILQRLRELSVKSATGTLTEEDRGNVQTEVDQLVNEVNRISSSAEFNTIKLLDGSFGGGKATPIQSSTPEATDANAGEVTATAESESPVVTTDGGTETAGGRFIHVGANIDQRVLVSINDMSATGLHVQGLDLKTADSANQSISVLDEALKTVSKERSNLGAFQNRLESVVRDVDSASENLQASESRIRDTDMAKEMVKYTRDSILNQATVSVLSQANQRTQSVLQLLQ